MPKYTGREIVTNEEDEYKDLLEIRGIDTIQQFKTFFFNRKNIKNSYGYHEHVWKKGDKLYKIANKYYGDIEFWWIIAMWNNKPTDANFKIGDVIEVPYPAGDIYRDLTE